VVFIFITILLDMFALGLIMPNTAKTRRKFRRETTRRAPHGSSACSVPHGALIAIFLLAHSWWVCRDRFGRRPVVLLSNLGLAFDYVLMALAPSLVWLFIGRVISGITSASISTAFAYIADVTPPERRAGRYSAGSAWRFGAGFILGPALGGLLGGLDPRLPFWVAAGLSFCQHAVWPC